MNYAHCWLGLMPKIWSYGTLRIISHCYVKEKGALPPKISFTLSLNQGSDSNIVVANFCLGTNFQSVQRLYQNS